MRSVGCGWVQDVFGLRSSGHDHLYIPTCLALDQTPRQVTRKSRTRCLRADKSCKSRSTREGHAPVAKPRPVRQPFGSFWHSERRKCIWCMVTNSTTLSNQLQEEEKFGTSLLSGTEKFFKSSRPRNVLFGLLSNAFP